MSKPSSRDDPMHRGILAGKTSRLALNHWTHNKGVVGELVSVEEMLKEVGALVAGVSPWHGCAHWTHLQANTGTADQGDFHGNLQTHGQATKATG